MARGTARVLHFSLKKQVVPPSDSPCPRSEQRRLDDCRTAGKKIEAPLERPSVYVHGAKIMAEGGIAFLLLVRKTVAKIRELHEIIEKNPRNPEGRFFNTQLKGRGLVETMHQKV